MRNGIMHFDDSYEVKRVGDYYHGQVDVNGRACGIGRGMWMQGGIYEGEWAENNRNGFGRDIWGDGSTFFGDCIDGHVQGYGQKI